VPTEFTRGGASSTVLSVPVEIPVVIPSDREGVLVDWSSGCVQSNVGNNMNVESERVNVGSNSDAARQQAEDLLGELLFVVPPGLPPSTPWRVLEAETSLSAVSEDVLPGISTGALSVPESSLNVGNVREAHAAELVADSAQLVAVSDRAINVRKACTAVLAGTDSTTDGMDLERPRGQVQGRGTVFPVDGGGKSAPSNLPRKPPNLKDDDCGNGVVSVRGNHAACFQDRGSESTHKIVSRTAVCDNIPPFPKETAQKEGGGGSAQSRCRLRSFSRCEDQAVNYCQGEDALACDALYEASQSVGAAAWPEDLIGEVKRILGTEAAVPRAPDFEFKMNSESAEKNFLFLSDHDLDLSKALLAQKGSPLDYGSEFKPVGVLKPLFRHHPNWCRMEKILKEGSEWPMEDISPRDRTSDLKEALSFGNHKGASNNKELLKKLVEKDILHGYGLVLPLDKMELIPGVLMAPMNITNQNTIDETGKTIGKDRLTHDQSYEWGSGSSVNSRVLKDELLPCKFGACLKRLINWAVAARRKFPGKRILVSKIDYKSAYRRCHLGARTAIQTCTQLPEENLAVVALRLTFGGAPGPYEWGVISETICDLATAILQDDDWNPSLTRAPNSNLVPKKKVMSDDVPFGIGRQLIVDVPVDPRGTTDVYIDDTIALCVDLENTDNDCRLENATLLAIEAAARPVHEAEPIPRENMAALAKLLAEAGLEESKMILGMFFDFRRMTVALPLNKHAAWSRDIALMMERKETCYSDLDTCIGRLGNVGLILCPIYHFLSRLRELQRRAKSRRRIKIDETCLKDLKLMLYFLDLARDGIDLNQLAYRKPTHVYRSDSCPAGLGGYSHEGFAWRYYLPEYLQGRASNNLLEHLGCIITPWIDILAGRLGPGDCSLSMTDSSTSEGWQRKTNFKEDGEEPIQAEVRVDVAREDAKRRMEARVKNYSQWFPGKDNDVSDALSRDDDRSDEDLTNVLRLFVPSQVPSHFKIVPLPKEIVSWLTSLLLRLPVKEQLRERHTRTKLGRLGDLESISTQLESSMTTSLITSQKDKESKLWERLPWLCATEDFQDQLMTPWLKAQSEVPFHMWLRPSGRMTGQIQQKMKTASLADFYLGNTGPSETRTQM
jgi:hypothetical protein